MKTCFKCGRVLELDQFYKHPQMSDGHLNKCKSCTKQDMAVDRVLNPEKHAARDKARLNKPKRRADKRRYEVLHRQRHPEKYAARTAVGNALRDGKLIKPGECQKCGRPGKVEAHHYDYLRPLDVEWLCFSCHRTHEHGQITVT